MNFKIKALLHIHIHSLKKNNDIYLNKELILPFIPSKDIIIHEIGKPFISIKYVLSKQLFKCYLSPIDVSSNEFIKLVDKYLNDGWTFDNPFDKELSLIHI